MSTTTVTLPPYLEYLISTSSVAKKLEDIMGTDKLVYLFNTGKIINLIIEENLLDHFQLQLFFKEMEEAGKNFDEDNNEYIFDEYDDFVDYAPCYDINHRRKNKARRHRKALKREKRGDYRSVPYSRLGWGLYNKLEKQAQTKKAQARDFKSQEKEYYTTDPELEVLEITSCSDTNVTHTKSPAVPNSVHKKSFEELIDKDLKKVIDKAVEKIFYTGYDVGFEKGKEITHRDSYAAGFEAGYAAAMKKVKEDLAKFSSNL